MRDVDGCDDTATYGIGYDVGVGGGILLVVARRYSQHQAAWYYGCGECFETAQKWRFIACNNIGGE